MPCVPDCRWRRASWRHDIEQQSRAKAKQQSADERYGAQAGERLYPLIPAFIASPGLITGIINILKRPDIVGSFATHYPEYAGVDKYIWQRRVSYYEYPVGVNTAKVSVAPRDGG